MWVGVWVMLCIETLPRAQRSLRQAVTCSTPEKGGEFLRTPWIRHNVSFFAYRASMMKDVEEVKNLSFMAVPSLGKSG